MDKRLLDALRGQNHGERPPVWIMRQAGRYLPQYRALRRQHSLLSLFRQPEMIARITALPVDLLGVDAAILYTDILIVLDALGVAWTVKPDVGPVIEPLRRVEEVDQLEARPAAEALDFVLKGIGYLKQTLDVPLLGFCGAPFTLACYLLEGKTSRDFTVAKQWMYRAPEHFHSLLSVLTEVAIDFLRRQIEAGVDAIQVFDSWAHALTPHSFMEFSRPYLQRIVKEVSSLNVPVILFSRGSAALAPLLAGCRPNAVGLDWQCDLKTMRTHLPEEICLQGNLDPCALYAPHEVLRQEIDRILIAMQGDPGFVFNLGHGILPDAPVEAVQFLVDRIKSGSTWEGADDSLEKRCMGS